MQCSYITTRKLINTNKNTEEICLTDITDDSIPSVYTEGITVGNKIIKIKQKKNDDVMILSTELPPE
jgi:hypothetical protein